jgi:hypothetical protein
MKVEGFPLEGCMDSCNLKPIHAGRTVEGSNSPLMSAFVRAACEACRERRTRRQAVLNAVLSMVREEAGSLGLTRIAGPVRVPSAKPPPRL